MTPPMSRLLAGWQVLDPALVRLLRINVAALVTATAAVAIVYVAGFRHTTVLVDLAVMLVSILLALATAPLAQRAGAPGAIRSISRVASPILRVCRTIPVHNSVCAMAACGAGRGGMREADPPRPSCRQARLNCERVRRAATLGRSLSVVRRRVQTRSGLWRRAR